MKTTYLSEQSGQEKIVMGLTVVFVVAFACFFYFFQGNTKKVSVSETQNINYEMAKVKTAEHLYNLDGREIDRDSQELEVIKSNQKATLIKNPKANASAKKSEVAKATVKKNEAAADKAQAVKKSTAATKTSIVRSEVVNAEALTESNHSNNQVYPQPVQVATQPQTDVSTEDSANIKKEFKSIGEWTKEIFASDDRQIILKFVSAYKNKEVSETDFYALITQLLASKEESKKGFGLYALRAAPSYASYVVLVKNQSQLNATYQTYVQETLLSYHQASSLNYLRLGLNSNDKQIVLKTIEIVKLGVNDIKNGSASALVESRYRRDNSFSGFAVQNYQSFLPLLAQLQTQSQQSGDLEISAAAQGLTQTIQSTVVVAVN